MQLVNKTRLSVIFVVTAILVSATVVGAEDIYQDAFVPISPEIMAQGNSFLSVTEGYYALLTNPAGIANNDKSELTVTSLTVWTHSHPNLILPTVAALVGETEDTGTDQQTLLLDVLTEQFTTNGFGVGVAYGFGYTGKRIGFGLNLAMDTYLYGNTFPLGLEGSIDSQLSFVIGYAQPLHLGPVTLIPGIDIRPVLRITSLVDSTAASGLLSQFMGVDTGSDSDESITEMIWAYNGWGIAFDAGLMAKFGDITLGMQIRDLFDTKMEYSRNNLDEILSSLSSGGLPEIVTDSSDTDHYVSDSYYIRSAMNVGASWQPDLGPIGFLVDPEIHFELSDILNVSSDTNTDEYSLWTKIHAGAEVTFLRFFDYRIGINQGYATMGFGLDLALMEINAALFSQEFGRYPGDRQVGGASLEVAFRY